MSEILSDFWSVFLLLLIIGAWLFVLLRTRSGSLSLQQSQVHAEFQRRIRELQEHAPPEMLDHNLRQADKNTMKYIYLYFFLVFDEYHICKVVSPKELSVLWDKFYATGVKDALQRPLFREVLQKIKQEDSDLMFFGAKQAFFKEMDRLCQEATGRAL